MKQKQRLNSLLSRALQLMTLCCILLLSKAYSQTFSSDIPLLQPQHLTAEYWLAKVADADQVLLSVEQINEFNRQTFLQQPGMLAISEIPMSRSASELSAVLQKVSAPPGSARFFADGRQLGAADWVPLLQQLNPEAIQADNPTRFGLVTQRALMRAVPSELRVFNEAMALDLNRFQETAVFVGEPVAVLHQSLDGNWLLVQNYHYTGWVPTTAIALGRREQVLAYADAKPFLVVTGARAKTNFVPGQAAISELQLDMGVRLPLLDAAVLGHNIHGQNPHASHIVQLPVRDANGQLVLVPALIGRNQDVVTGYLPYTTRNVVQQAFKYLGQRYGWGYDYNSVDCTGFLVDIFRTFGLLMPRNSGEQGYGGFGQNQRFDESLPVADKLAKVHNAKVGDFIYRPGHVMLYLGQSQGEPFVIHAVYDLAYYQADGQFYRGTLNGVAVTPLTPLYLSEEQSYLQRLYNIKSLR